MIFDLIHRLHEVLNFLCRKNYHAVVAIAEETSYLYIVNTSIQTPGSEFYSHPTLQAGLGRSVMYLSCTVMYSHGTVM